MAEKLTVAICTHNRAAILDETLAALAAAEPPRAAALEVLIVLNACSDDSPAVVERWRGRLPIAVAEEPRPGVSHARNAAIDAATGSLILWIDDDATPLPGWLRAYEAAAARWPDTAFFGGTIRPRFLGTPPRWLLEALPAIAAAFGDHPGGADGEAVRPGATPFAGNLAVRVAVQRRRRFDTGLGRAPVGWVRGGEEAAFLETLLLEGANGRWVTGAEVEHRIGPEKQTRRFVRESYYGYGRDRGLAARRLAERNAALARGAADPAIDWAAPPEVLARVYPRRRETGPLGDALGLAWVELRTLYSRFFRPPRSWAAHRSHASALAGYWRSRYGRSS